MNIGAEMASLRQKVLPADSADFDQFLRANLGDEIPMKPEELANKLNQLPEKKLSRLFSMLMKLSYRD